MRTTVLLIGSHSLLHEFGGPIGPMDAKDLKPLVVQFIVLNEKRLNVFQSMRAQLLKSPNALVSSCVAGNRNQPIILLPTFFAKLDV